MSNLIVEVINVTKTYSLGKPNEVTAVKNASLQIKEGNLVVLKGPSGSGKTTLLSLIGCQTKPTRGEVVILGKRISKLPEKFMNLHKRSHIGFIFQHFQLIAGMSVLDNIVLPLIPEGISPKERSKRADRLLEQFNLAHRKQFKVSHLSGGEQQRVAIARALINNADIILADEPSAHLDSKLTSDLLDHIKLLKQSGYTILITSHDPIIYQHSAVDRVFEMKDGQMIS
ncbi:MAG: ABC transporter ATP-binding protein [Deltaproteobacteria bacterium]|nr:ABC transporter ATP-binding protein [Deltaproteobacteria bacterium]